jgi:hypothetical protein
VPTGTGRFFPRRRSRRPWARSCPREEMGGSRDREEDGAHRPERAGHVALPALGLAQAQTFTRGVLGGSLSPDSTTGLLRGALPQGATTGVVRGSLPSGGTAGLIHAAPPGATVGVFRNTFSAATVPVMPGGFAPTLVPTLRGPLPADAAVGTLSAPARPGTRLGEPGPGEIEHGLNFQARLYLVDHNFAQGETMLNQSMGIREEMVGRIHHEVAGASRPTRSFCATTTAMRRPPTWMPAPGDPHEAGAAGAKKPDR